MIDLRHGDCLNILPTLPDNSVSMIFCDPPFGHNNNNNGDLISRWEQALGQSVSDEDELANRRPIANDGAEANELFRAVLPEFRRLLVPGGCCCCCCGGGGPDPQFARWSLWLDEVFDFKQMVVWDKGPMGMGWHYRRSYETVLVAQKPGAACKWYDISKRIENIIRPGAFGVRKIIPQADEHPTAKPVHLAQHFIQLHSLPGEVVLDAFMGEGSTGVACVKTGRSFIGIELDEQYFTTAKRRIEDAQRRKIESPALPLEVPE
jgi:site-specific DNA-methyltransferase (adenine-specific)